MCKAINIIKEKINKRNSCTLGAHSRWEPGTDKLVINIVAQRKRNTEPDKAQKRLIAMDLKEVLKN